jgi:NADPH:quinone reductase-like Zn-dependent oxidoreductase
MGTKAETGTTMRAIVRERFGSLDRLELRTVGRPALADDGVLVRVRASSVNPVDRYEATGTPWVVRPTMGLFRPKSRLIGSDFAGTVEAVGADVADLHPGDEVYGDGSGSFAEYVFARTAVVRKPTNLTFEQAAAVPVAGLTALQGLRDHGRLRSGQSVLINGASGGVGTFAVQIAKALGAEVTAVCSTRNVDQARALGADVVVDYTRDDFTRTGRRYDLILDIAGSRRWSDCRRVLHSEGAVVLAGASSRRSAALGPLGHIARMRVASIRGGPKVVFFIAKPNKSDLEVLREMLESGRVTPVIERTYDLSETGAALRLLGEGHARGKLVITVSDETPSAGPSSPT